MSTISTQEEIIKRLEGHIYDNSAFPSCTLGQEVSLQKTKALLEQEFARLNEQIEAYHMALSNIAEPMAALKAFAEREGCIFDAAKALNCINVEYLRAIAKMALETKP